MDECQAAKVLAERINSLQTIIETRWEAHTREHQLLAENLATARMEMNRRLAEMNEMRDQINQAESKLQPRGDYLTRDMFEREHGIVLRRVDDVRDTIGTRIGENYEALTARINALEVSGSKTAGGISTGTYLLGVVLTIMMGILGYLTYALQIHLSK